ncbi:FMN-binding protein [Lactococcus lactis]|nr:FMN-binding protein [Lactococcus lactis]
MKGQFPSLHGEQRKVLMLQEHGFLIYSLPVMNELAPAAGMHYLEEDIKVNDTIYLMLGVREVEGKNGYQGIGFRVSAKAKLISNGPEFEMMKEKYPFLRAVLELTPVEVEQLL